MKTKLIAIATAGAIAMSGLTAAPAQAGQADDLARFLIGAAIIGVVVNEVNRNNTQATVTTTRHRTTHRPHRTHQAQVNRHKPRQCLRQKWTSHGWKKFFNKSCMARFGWHQHRSNGRWHKGHVAHR